MVMRKNELEEHLLTVQLYRDNLKYEAERHEFLDKYGAEASNVVWLDQISVPPRRPIPDRNGMTIRKAIYRPKYDGKCTFIDVYLGDQELEDIIRKLGQRGYKITAPTYDD